MDGFGAALDGYYEVDDRLTRYLQARADEHFAETRAEKRAIDSRAAFEARRERVREQFLDGIGRMPDRSRDLPVETVGRDERDGYAVERIVFERRPNHRITANCYVPDGEGPHPGVLFCCGHVGDPKGDEYNQRACIELALHGFVVLIFDPVGQGERTQYDEIDGIPQGGGGVFEHSYAGQKCFYAGASLARYVIADGWCALDYLAGRPDVDDERIAVTGTSGGGVQTLYLALVDDRIDAAAPCCTVTTRREWLKTGKRVDAEQLIHGAIPAGIDYDDFLTAMAPRPVCVGAAASDPYFPIEGAREAVERARRVYDLYDAAENLRFVVEDTTHCSVYELREGVFDFLCTRLGDGPYEPRDIEPVDPAELRCTPEGSVREAYPDERPIDDLIAEYVVEQYPDGGVKEGSPGEGEADNGIRERITEAFDLDPDRGVAPLEPRFVDQTTEDGLTVERVWFRTERDPDAVVAGVLVTDPDAEIESPAVVCYADGTEALPDRTGDVAALAREHGAVFVFDPRGVGAVRNRSIPIPSWVEDYHGIYGTEFKLAYDALALGSSLFGMRVADVLRAIEFLRAETGAEKASLVGEGIGAYHALYAAGAAEDVDRVELRDLGPTFRELATERDAPYRSRLTVFDALSCDLPDVLAALDNRDVRVECLSPDG